jgi:sarcosine oxidase
MPSNNSITASTFFDVIVIGVGSMGSSACYFLAQRGYKVLGLEQFDIPHEYGSHTGQSRIIRKAYFEDPGYVPLLDRAYKNWKELEKETGTQIYYRTGLVYFGNPENKMMQGVKQSASLYTIPLDILHASSPSKRFSQFKIPGSFETLFEPDAGFITPEKAIFLYKAQAIKKGAEIHTQEKVIEWKKDGTSVVVSTDKNFYRCNKLVITAGAWSGKLIPLLADKIRVTRQFIAWIKPKKEGNFTLDNFPCWMLADDEKPGCYYGFPVLPIAKFGEPAGLKMAYHYPGVVNDPDSVNRQTIPGDLKDLQYLLDKYLPGSVESVHASKTCLYGNSPDENFIIDKLRGYEEHVIIAGGFSGHGFKFVSVVGEILAELAIEGKSKQPIDFLNANRFPDKLVHYGN